MKKYLIILALFSFASLEGQPSYNYRLENNQIQALGQLVHELEDSYLGIGRGIDTIDFLRGIYASEFDKETGEVLNTSKITFPNDLLFFNNNNTVLNIDGRATFLFHRSDTIYLTSYTEESMDLEIRKKIFSTVETSSLFIYDFKRKDDILHILAGHSDGENDQVIFKYDLVNDVLTETFIYDSLGFMFTSKMVPLNNGNALVTYRIPIDGKLTQFVIEVDKFGNTLWKYQHNIPKENFSFSFIPIGQEEYLIGAAKSKLNPTDPEGESTPFLMKFDYDQKKVVANTDFNVPQNEWFKWNSAVNEIVPTHDNDAFMCIAKLYEVPINPDTLQSFGMVAKVDRDLNVLWKRTYARNIGEYYDNDLKDIIATSDGNYLAYGTSIKTYSYPGEAPALSWVIKIDEEGKLVGDTSTTTIDWEISELKDEIEIFPNPAFDVLYINQDDVSDVNYSIFGLNGRLEDRFTLSSSYLSVTKSIQDWSSGQKIIVMSRNEKVIGTTRIVKQ